VSVLPAAWCIGAAHDRSAYERPPQRMRRIGNHNNGDLGDRELLRGAQADGVAVGTAGAGNAREG